MLPARVANLRADVWRLAAQPPESEDAFLTTLLGQLGRALLSARAAIYERDGHVFRCTHEWVGGEGRSVPAHEIACEVAEALAPDGKTTEVTPEQVRLQLARAGLEEPVWFQRWVDGPPRLRSALFVPVNHGAPDAWTLILSQAGEHTAPFPAEIRTVVEEIVQIVALVVARKRAESALRANELRYRTLVESLGEGVGIMDETETFLFANPTGHEIFGVEPGALVGRNLREFLEPGELDRVIEQTALRRQGQRSTYELAIRCPDGSRRIIVATVVPEIDAHGRFAASIGSFFDVTELKRQEEERARIEAAMHHAQKLESLGLLAGGIAHDFNNLLVGVMTNADLALSMAEHSPPVVECLEDILTAARRAAELTSRMLAYAGRGRVNIEPLDLHRVVQEMGILLRSSISRSAVVKIESAGDLPLFDGDAAQVRQIVMNMVTNASDALGDEPGTIELRTGVVDGIDEQSPHLVSGKGVVGPHVFMEVTDTGCGMDEATRSRMFDPFFTTKFKGRGMGLAAVLGIVRAHHGAIEVQTAPARGTRFRVLFPASGARRSQVQRHKSSPAAPWTGSGLVLVVDDEEMVRSATARMLGKLGFEVVLASDGVEALQIVRARGHELRAVLLDLTMPRMGGEETLFHIRALHPALPITMMTGFVEKEAELRDAGHAFTSFLRKPFDTGRLVAALREVLEPEAPAKAPS